MPLVPKISVSINNKCNSATITEETGLYVLGENDGGWGGINIDTNDTVSATLEIFNLDSTLVEIVDIYSVYATLPSAPTPGAFIVTDDALWQNPDGIYELIYTVATEEIIYTNERQHELFLCNLCSCKDNLIVKMLEACDSPTVEKLKTQVDQMEIFVYGIQSAFSCGDFDTATSILEAATTYCQTLSDCGCGCGGC